jgi:hypothetical protein
MKSITKYFPYLEKRRQQTADNLARRQDHLKKTFSQLISWYSEQQSYSSATDAWASFLSLDKL